MQNIYKILLLLIFSTASYCWAESNNQSMNSDFYEPNTSNAYQGRLFYDPTNEDYTIGKMIKLCEPFTGIDTAQIKCTQQDKQKLKVCTYKCSMHWLIKKE